MEICGADSAVYGGKCVTKSDVNDLWNLFLEVYYCVKFLHAALLAFMIIIQFCRTIE